MSRPYLRPGRSGGDGGGGVARGSWEKSVWEYRGAVGVLVLSEVISVGCHSFPEGALLYP